MNKSLYTKLVLIIILLILSLMVIVGAFLLRGIRDFYVNSFYNQMQSVFSNAELVDDLRSASDGNDSPQRMAEILKAYYGLLGIDSGTRNYYILSGDTGAYLTGSAPGSTLEMTPNIYTAISGSEGYASDAGADYMDVALPIHGTTGNYIVYIKDNKQTVQALSSEIFRIILESMVIGLVISIALSLILAKAMVTPLQSLTRAAEKVAAGDFSDKVDNDARDEIGVLTRTFNEMAGQLESNLDDLRRSEQMRREFVANVSHELRTPITSIRSYAETLADNDDVPPQMRRDFLGVIVNESDRMTKIVQDLLTLSRFDAGSISFKFEQFSFADAVTAVYNATVMEAQKHRHKFVLSLPDSVPDIRGDRARIEQVLINMVSNAIKYTPDGGRIRLTAGSGNGKVWASVRDNGIGIPEADVGRVFERFYRVDKARSRESGGTGLGLSIAQEIVARHDGTIGIKSTQGKGTTITVTLPVEGPANE